MSKQEVILEAASTDGNVSAMTTALQERSVSPHASSRNAAGQVDAHAPNMVLHIDFSGQGVMTHVLAIIDHADRSCWKHEVLHGRDKSRPAMDHYAAELESREIKAWCLEVKRQINRDDFAVLLKTLKIVDCVKPKLIHCHSAKGGAIGRIAGLLKGVPVVYTPHAFSFLSAGTSQRLRYAYMMMERFLGKLTKQVVAVSANERILAIEAGVVSAQRVTAIPNGIDMQLMKKARARRQEMRSELGLGPMEKVLCFIGRLVAQKAPLMLPKVAAALKSLGSTPTFLIIGDGPLLGEFEESLDNLGVRDQFKMLGWRSREDALAYVASSDVLLLPSIYEGLPYAPLEAQALGTVPVVTRFEGADEALLDGKTGLLVPIDDHDAMAQAVYLLVSDDALLGRLSTAGPEFIQRERNVESTVRSIESVYGKALN